MNTSQLYKPSDPFTPTPKLSELFLVEDQLLVSLDKAEGLIKQACFSLLQSGGKRVRPLLTLNSGMCFSSLNPLIIKAAAAAELIHMASLVHDDVIDESTDRRGKPTLSSLYGSHSAVLTGDYLFAEAFHILSRQELVCIMNYFIDAIQAMCDGEVNQAEEQFSFTVSRQQYFSRIAKKTGILLATCCQAGATLAGASSEEIDYMFNYGLNIGYAYQITDDILDISGDPNVLGKPVGSDLVNGNLTLPIIYLLDNPIYGNWVKEILKTQSISPQGILSIREALVCSGCLEQSYRTVRDCINTAKASLDTIPTSPYKSTLIEIADFISNRTT